MKRTLAILALLFGLGAWAQTDTVPPQPIDIEKLSSNDGSLTRVDSRPRFPSGEEGLLRYLRTELRYPEAMRQAKVEGTVQVAFTISVGGNVQNVRVLRGIAGGAALDAEAVRVVSAMPRWEPARVKDVPVPMDHVLPVSFTTSGRP